MRSAWFALTLLAGGCGLVGYDTDDTPIDPVACYQSISVGEDHACVVNRAGRVYCWGKDERGQSSGTIGRGFQLTPTEIPLPTFAREVAAGWSASCAVLDDARLFCWGGRLGMLTMPPYGPPTELQPGLRAFHVGLGNQYGCAKVGTDADDRVDCWGNGESQRLGQADSANHPELVTVPGPTGLAGLFVGPRSACARDGVGDIWCWGADERGQLALGPGTGSRGPTIVPALRGLDDLAIGDSGACSIASSNLRCWGANDLGQLGSGAVGPDERVPGAILATDITDLGAMTKSFCAVDTSQRVRCWGQNRAGELGLGDLAIRPDPIEVLTLQGTTQVAAGGHAACVEHNGQLVCWGGNIDGQLGRGTRGVQTAPRQIGMGTTWTQVRGAGGTLCAIDDQSALYCWGDGELYQGGFGEQTGVPAPRMIKAGVREVAVGMQHVCARGDTDLMCWGLNGVGQLGDPTFGPYVTRPQDGHLVSSTPIAAVTVGDGHSCAIIEGALQCWGFNGAGQVGDGSMINRARPVPVPITGPTKVAAGGSHTCAIDVMGFLWCWGAGASGQLGAGATVLQSSDPVQVMHPGGRPWTQVVAGRAHTCAIDDQRTLWCWGANGAGQTGSAGGDAMTPRRVDWPAAVGDAHQVFIRYDSTCLTTFSGDARCWGEDGFGAIGVGGIVPRQFGTVTTIDSFGGGQFTLCAVKTNGELWCAGAGDRGQLGEDLLGWAPMRVDVPCE